LQFWNGRGIIKTKEEAETDFLSFKNQKTRFAKEGGVLQMLKDKLQSIVEPKISWLIITITILVALCVCLYVIQKNEKTLRINTEQQLSRTNAAKDVLSFKLVEANKEIAARDEQIKLTLDKLEVAIKEKEALEGKIKEMTVQSPNIELPEIVVKTHPQE